MRDWIKPILVSCIALLGVAVFILEHRISNLEAQLSVARSGIAAGASREGSLTGVVLSHSGDALLSAEPAPVVVLDSKDSEQQQLRDLMTLQWTSPAEQPVRVLPPQYSVRPPHRERQPSGVINGIPYYYMELSMADN